MPKLLLSGWAQPGEALSMLAPEAAVFDYSAHAPGDGTFSALEHYAQAEEIIAWSLGGALALNAIAAGVLKPKHLTLIATPYQFVSDATIKGMDPLTFGQFRKNYRTNPARTKNRFHALVAKGDAKNSEVMGALDHHPNVEETARWLPWLDYLASHPVSKLKLEHIPHTLIIHGMGDVVVPHTQAAALSGALPGSTMELWQNAGHAPHLHDHEKLRQRMAEHRQ